MRTYCFPRGGLVCLGASSGEPLQPVAWFWCIGYPGGYTLPFGFPTDGLPELTRQYCVIVTPCDGLAILLSSTVIPALTDSPFHLGIPYQACMDIPLPEVHLPGYPRPDLLGPADAQPLCEDNVGKYEGPLGVPGSTEYPPPLCS